MNGNGKTPIPFQAPAGTPLVGQPFTIVTIGIPMNLTLICNCPRLDDTSERPVLAIILSAPVACPSCGKTYSAFFNPQNGQTVMNIQVPPAEQVPL